MATQYIYIIVIAVTFVGAGYLGYLYLKKTRENRELSRQILYNGLSPDPIKLVSIAGLIQLYSQYISVGGTKSTFKKAGSAALARLYKEQTKFEDLNALLEKDYNIAKAKEEPEKEKGQKGEPKEGELIFSKIFAEATKNEEVQKSVYAVIKQAILEKQNQSKEKIQAFIKDLKSDHYDTLKIGFEFSEEINDLRIKSRGAITLAS